MEAALALTSSFKGLALQAVEPTEDDVILGSDELDSVHDCFLLGYFGSRFPGKEALLHLCNSWNVQVRFHALPTGWIIFIFGNEFDSQRVLQSGPYFVEGRPLVMKSMPECFEFEDEMIKTVPVWIRLPSLPLDCWNGAALSKIASKVGTPLCSDVDTSTKEKVSFARVLVEVDVSETLDRSVRIKLPVGKSKTRVQPVVFEREPGFYSFRSSVSNQPQMELVAAASVNNAPMMEMEKYYVEDKSGLENAIAKKKLVAAKGINEIEVEPILGDGDDVGKESSPRKSKSKKKRRKEAIMNEEEEEGEKPFKISRVD
ncbi:hypothetical protein C2S53_006376 [Perilla frutescens var. hirtella]|uniref:DUF4283 domain-containing protein n=1 Tax=Perilla frutescens var. hirtella TaxID=608512 RepID=A0AAD4JKH0_PERFH|nr:hypothetical protein C2S53_006376 [Perilla frutescens var. hirtella]